MPRKPRTIDEKEARRIYQRGYKRGWEECTAEFERFLDKANQKQLKETMKKSNSELKRQMHAFASLQILDIKDELRAKLRAGKGGGK